MDQSMEYYDYPESKIGIFTPCDRNYYFVSSKSSYLCSFEEMLDVNKAKQFNDRFVLLVYKRYAVVHNGTVVYKNTEFNDGHPPCGRHGENAFVIVTEKPRTYYRHSYKDYIISYEIMDDSELNSSGYELAESDVSCDYRMSNPRVYKSAESAVSDAVRISGESGEKCIVAQWFDDFDRYVGLYGGLYDKYGFISQTNRR